MSRLIESICLNEGVFYRLPYHQARMDKSVNELFHQPNTVQLGSFLRTQPYPVKGLFKCRIVYHTRIQSVEFVPYTIAPVNTLKVVETAAIDYAYKFENRSALHRLFKLRDGCDDILIVKNRLLTDAYYSNVILFDGNTWFTPAVPLLKGTMRQSLLKEGKVKEAAIRADDIRLFKKIRLVNAMLGFNGPELSVSQIVF